MGRNGSAAALTLLALTALTGVLVLSTGAALAHPPEDPPSGFDDPAFDMLWSRDAGSTVDRNASVSAFLTETSDVSFLSPPAAAASWNVDTHASQDVEDVIGDSGAAESVHPIGAERVNASAIKDAYVAFFAVQPGTKVHLGPNRTDYVVPPDGEVLAVADARAEMNAGCNPEVQTEAVRLRTAGSGDLHDREQFEKIPVLAFDGLSKAVGGLRLEAEFYARAQNPGSSCVSPTTSSETITVSTEMNVSVTDLSGAQADLTRFPDGDIGVYATYPGLWGGLSLPGNGTVHSPFRFFSARRRAWDEMRRSDGGGSTAVDEDRLHLHPLQIHAYPSQTGVSARGGGDPVVRGIQGPRFGPPDLPDDVNVDVVRGNYTVPVSYDVRYGSDGEESVRTRPLYRGNTTPFGRYRQRPRINRSRLTLEAIAADAAEVTLRIRLEGRETGEPIGTVNRSGWITVLGDTRVNTSDEGLATVTVARPTGPVTAHYRPESWWNAGANETAYDGTRASLLVTRQDDAPSLPDTVVRFFVLLSPFLIMMYLLDRGFGLDIWPPWRKI